jgi:pantothenate synthetase
MGVKIETTSWVLAFIGVAVVGLGYMMSGALRAGAFGFGIAFIVLGLFDMVRPKVNR